MKKQFSHCRIAWKSKSTGAEGSGKWFGISCEQMLKDCIIDGKRKNPDLKYWLEKK